MIIIKYVSTLSAKFISRPNRFIAIADVGGVRETVHVRNTGRCRELLLPGSEIILSASDNPARKTRYDLVAVKKEGLGWVNIDSQAPNTVVKEWLRSGASPFSGAELIKPEYVHGSSRVDFYLERRGRKIFIEVKGCTLELGGTGYFPDAPTERGVRHLRELTKAVGDGYDCYLAFVIQMPGVSRVLPNRAAHPEFAEALEEAVRAGVRILYLSCEVSPEELSVSGYSCYPEE